MSRLPSYVTTAKPVPAADRCPWYQTIAPTYAGVSLWFVFWQDLGQGAGSPGGVLAAGIGPAVFGLVLAAVIAHVFFYLAPAMLGMRTGLPLYVVGTSTYGVRGGLIMPGFLWVLLQFGWLAVNSCAVAKILCRCFRLGLQAGPTGALEVQVPGLAHGVIATTFIVVAAVVGLKGIRYVARVATYLPLIPISVLAVLLITTWNGLSGFNTEKIINARPPVSLLASEAISSELTAAKTSVLPMGHWAVIGFLCTYIVGFFTTPGAAGTDIAATSRSARDVHLGGLIGIVVPTILAGIAVLLILAGAYGAEDLIRPENLGKLNPVDLMPDLVGPHLANAAMVALAISSLPPACFSAFIAAHSLKNTMPAVNPYLPMGIGASMSVILSVTGVAGNAVGVFQVLGASFGPLCGAMLADCLLARGKWPGPRAGFNLAGWISWVVGFVVGVFNLAASTAVERQWKFACDLVPDLTAWRNYVPVPPVAAMVVGFALYLVLSLIGVRTRTLAMPASTS